MKPILRITLFSIFLFTSAASADYDLSIAGMNANMERCYQQTQLFNQNSQNKVLPTVSCSRVINNSWTSKKVEYAMLVNRGLVHQNNGDMDKAKQDFVRAAQVDPSRKEALIAAAQLFFNSGHYAESVDYYDRAMALQNDNPALQHNREIAAKLLEHALSLRLSMQR